MMTKIIGVDTGGTFTDIVVLDVESREINICKISSESEKPAKNIMRALENTGVNTREINTIIHATTIATNAIVERKGDRTGFLTNRGFKDIVFIQRGDQEYSYDLQWIKPKPLVKRRDCKEIDCRMDADGNVLKDLNSEEIDKVVQEFKDEGIRTVAVAFLFSYVNPSHELRVREAMKKLYPECCVSLSHEVYPKWREYERFSTTIADAYLKPLFGDYIKRLANGLKKVNKELQLLIMKSNGGITDCNTAVEQPVESIMSGPVGGVLAASYFSKLLKERSVIGVDIGGTSSDVSLIENKNYRYTTSFMLEFGIPISVPMVDVKSIGAGGGSIAWIDKGGLLRVGPQSAGALPGPACYGLGGNTATLTDANLVLGRLNPKYFCGGSVPLYVDKANETIGAICVNSGKNLIETASDIVELACSNMANAIRLVTVEKGIDPRNLSILGFGGAGGLHVSHVAEMLGIKKVIIPVYPGVTSALGLLTADLRLDRMITFLMRSDLIDEDIFNEYLQRARAYTFGTLKNEGLKKDHVVLQSLEMRYYGQNYQIEVPIPGKERLTREEIESVYDLFRQKHMELYGYENPGDIAECVGMNVRTIGRSIPPKIKKLQITHAPEMKEKREVYFGKRRGFEECPIYERTSLPAGFGMVGPAIVEEPVSTIILLPGHEMKVDSYGNIIIEVMEDQHNDFQQ